MSAPNTDAIKTLGQTYPQQQEYEREYDPDSGYTESFRWESFDEAAVLAFANVYALRRIAHRLTFNGGVAHLVAKDTSGAVSIDTWQMLANESQKGLWEHPYMLYDLGYGTSDYGTNVGILQEGVDLRTDFSKISADPDFYVSNESVVEKFYQLAMRGSDEYAFSQHVLRHTTNVSNRYDSNVADFNVDCIYTATQLLNETQDSGSWIYPLPGHLAYVIQYLDGAGAPDFQTGYVWGWLKRSSTRTTAANNRIDITTEYWLQQWPTILYPLAS